MRQLLTWEHIRTRDAVSGTGDDQLLSPLVEMLKPIEAEVSQLQAALSEGNATKWQKFVVEHPPSASAIALLLIATEKTSRSKVAGLGGNARDISEGYADKREKICAAWASGKFSSRDVCAEQESAALGMPYSTARKALRNTPEPDRSR